MYDTSPVCHYAAIYADFFQFSEHVNPLFLNVEGEDNIFRVILMVSCVSTF